MNTLCSSDGTKDAEAACVGAFPENTASGGNVGKIARLPASVREELNRRLAEGGETAGILAWINELPEVKAILSARFNGQPINDANISRWRGTGYASWQEKQLTLEAVQMMAAACGGLKQETQEMLSARIAFVLTARLALEVQKFDAMPEGERKMAAWKDLIWSQAHLRRGDVCASKLQLDREKLELSPAARDQAAQAESGKMSPEERQLKIDEILGTGKYEIKWDNAAKKMVGPGAAAYYEEEAISTRLRQEIKERKKAGTWPSEGGVL